MVPTSFLTRTFAISALLVGVFTIVNAAPVPHSYEGIIEARTCRQSGCTMDAVLPSIVNSTKTEAAVSDPRARAVEIILPPPAVDFSKAEDSNSQILEGQQDNKASAKSFISVSSTGTDFASTAVVSETERRAVRQFSRDGVPDRTSDGIEERSPSDMDTGICRQSGCL